MATRRGPGEPVDPFASLPLGQTLSGDRERSREAARRALDAALGQPQTTTEVPPTLPTRAAETLAALRETPAEAMRSADLAAIQRDIAERAEQARQQSLRMASGNGASGGGASVLQQRLQQRQAADARARQEEIRQRALRARQAEEARQDHERIRAENARIRAEIALDAEPDAHTLLAIERRLHRKVEAVQRALTVLTDDLAEVQKMLRHEAPAPTGNEDAPFFEGERHLDLGEDK